MASFITYRLWSELFSLNELVIAPRKPCAYKVVGISKLRKIFEITTLSLRVYPASVLKFCSATSANIPVHEKLGTYTWNITNSYTKNVFHFLELAKKYCRNVKYLSYKNIFGVCKSKNVIQRY